MIVVLFVLRVLFVLIHSHEIFQNKSKSWARASHPVFLSRGAGSRAHRSERARGSELGPRGAGVRQEAQTARAAVPAMSTVNYRGVTSYGEGGGARCVNFAVAFPERQQKWRQVEIPEKDSLVRRVQKRKEKKGTFVSLRWGGVEPGLCSIPVSTFTFQTQSNLRFLM